MKNLDHIMKLKNFFKKRAERQKDEKYKAIR